MNAIATIAPESNWPSHLGENRYPPKRVMSALRLLPSMYPRNEMHILGLFVRAYAWYSGELSLCSPATRQRIMQDMREFNAFGVLPEYMNRMYEVKIPNGFRVEPTAASS